MLSRGLAGDKFLINKYGYIILSLGPELLHTTESGFSVMDLRRLYIFQHIVIVASVFTDIFGKTRIFNHVLNW